MMQPKNTERHKTDIKRETKGEKAKSNVKEKERIVEIAQSKFEGVEIVKMMGRAFPSYIMYSNKYRVLVEDIEIYETEYKDIDYNNLQHKSKEVRIILRIREEEQGKNFIKRVRFDLKVI